MSTAAANAATAGTDAHLKELKPSRGDMVPGFWGDRTEFAVVLPASAETIALIATTRDAAAKFTVDGKPAESGKPSASVQLGYGMNHVPIEVTAADGVTKKTYTFKVTRAHATPNWVRLRETSVWKPRDSAGEVVHDGKMWMFGGYLPELVGDVWNSTDGIEWIKVGDLPNPAGVNIPIALSYRGRMWVSTQDGKFYSSRDGVQWDVVLEEAPWSKRYAAGHVVFNDRMWVLGGAGGAQPGAKPGAKNDVWSSTDGVNWTLELAEAPWSPRQLFGNVAVFRGRMYIAGGGITSYQPFKGYRDVWSSPDGKNWTKETDLAPWPGRIWSNVAVYRGRLWLIGGFRGQPTWQNFADVWYSNDGATWQQLVTDDIWSPRHEISIYTHNDQLWVVGGNAWPLQNDVWRLDIRGLAFVTRPVLEEYLNCEYTYRAEADFNQFGGRVRYRMMQGPTWLTLDGDTGLLRGTPRDTGRYAVTLQAYDNDGETAVQDFTIDVLPG